MEFIKFIVRVAQILIGYKVAVLLYNTHNNYSSTDMNQLVWWSCLLILDIWIIKTFVPTENEENKDDESI